MAKLNEHFNKVLAEPATEYSTASSKAAAAPLAAQYLAAETAKWQRVVRETGVKVD